MTTNYYWVVFVFFIKGLQKTSKFIIAANLPVEVLGIDLQHSIQELQISTLHDYKMSYIW
jgi:hypothetical protein